MLHHGDTIKDVTLNIFNRESELTKPLNRLFQDSPAVLKELLPTLTKCLDAKRKIKSTSMEAILYTAIRNLIPEHEFTIDNQSIVEEVKSITDGEDIPGLQQAFYCQDLGKVTHRKITDTLVDKFKAERTSKGRDNEKKRALRFTKEDLDRKGIEYDVPDKIEILPNNQAVSRDPDSFDSILLEDKPGTQGTVLEGMDEGIDERKDSQIVKEIGDIENNNPLHEEVQDTKDVINPENSPTHPLEASPPSPPSPFENDHANTQEKSSASVLSTILDSNDKDESNRLEQLFTCPHCTKFKTNLEDVI
jgi:hypothetical protein